MTDFIENAFPWPSGHMTLATGAAVAALLLVPARWRPLTTVLGAVVSACTCTTSPSR